MTKKVKEEVKENSVVYCKLPVNLVNELLQALDNIHTFKTASERVAFINVIKQNRVILKEEDAT